MGDVGNFASVLLAQVFGLSSAFKFVRPSEFAEALNSFTVLDRLPQALRRSAGGLFPVGEVTCAVLLAIPITREVGQAATAVLISGLSAVLAADRRPSIGRCGCWGSIDIDTPRYAYLVRNAILVGLLALSVLGDGAPRPDPISAEAAVVIGMAFPFALLLLEFPHILHIALARRSSSLGMG